MCYLLFKEGIEHQIRLVWWLTLMVLSQELQLRLLDPSREV